MKQITISDVNLRLRSLNRIKASGYNTTFSESARLIINTNRVQDIKRLIETAGRSDKEVSISTIMELFDALAENGTVSDINKMGECITEGIVHKTRDAKSAGTVLKQRLTRWKNKLKVPSIADRLKKNKSQAITKVYENAIDKLNIYASCDRVLENYNRISKRFNLEVVFNENTRVNGVYDTVVELCNRIDTYDMPNTVKINTVIETALYGFESNFISYEKSDILEATLDYFAFKPNGLKDCKSIFEATMFYDKNSDMKNIDILTEEEPEENNSGDSSVDTMIRSYHTVSNPKVVKESTEFNEIFKKFKEEELSKEDAKPETKLRSLVTKLYSRNVDSIVDDTPNLLSWLRTFFIVGSCAVPVVGPILMIVSFIADRFISLHMDREEVKKMSKCFANEIKASKKKLESTTDIEDKQKLEKYIDSLGKAKEKIDTYYSGLLSDADFDTAYDDMDLEDFAGSGNIEGFDLGDDFDDWGFDDDDDFDFSISEMASLTESLITLSTKVTPSTMYYISEKISDGSVLKGLSEMVASYPEIFYKESFLDGLERDKSSIRKDQNISTINRSLKVGYIDGAIDVLESYKPVDNSTKTMTIFETCKQLYSIVETLDAINMINTNLEGSVLEASFSNTLKLASMKIKKAFKNLSDKEKSISKGIDVSMNNLSKSAERALTNDNRESILKGSILPSASKIIKIGIANAGLAAIGQPVLAVIGTLGYLGTSAKFKAKERQMLIDEIEIELKMCDKYISIAESKNDMKALKQLLMTKRDLERQLQRIKYKMKLQFGQKYYDAKNVGDK